MTVPATEMGWLGAVIAAALLVSAPFATGGVPDIEGFFEQTVGAVLAAKALLAAHSPLWTHDLGFGIPQPFRLNPFVNPLLPLFLLKNAFHAMAIVVAFYLIVGSVFVFLLARRLRIDPVVALCCAISFLLCSSTIQLIYADDWSGGVVSWSLFPGVLYAIYVLRDADSQNDRAFGALLLGVLGGAMVANGHISLTVVSVGGTLVLAGTMFWRFLDRWPWVLLAGCLIIAISLGYFAHLFAEYTQFAPSLPRNKHPEWPIVEHLWGMLARPFVLERPGDVLAANLNTQLRIASFGPVFGWLALVGLTLRGPVFAELRPWRVTFLLSFLAMFLPAAATFNLVGASWIFRDVVNLTGILLAGLVLKRIAIEGKRLRQIARAAAMVQVVLLAVATWPFAARVASLGMTDPAQRSHVLGDAGRTGPLIEHLQTAAGERPVRVLFAPRFATAIRSMNSDLVKQGILHNTLAIHGIAVVNSWPRGIATGVLFPESALMEGWIGTDPAMAASAVSLDVLGITHVLTFDEPPPDPTLVLDRMFDVAGHEVGVWRNTNAWPHAVVVDDGALERDLALLPGCSHDRLMCRDLAPLAASRRQGEVQVTATPGKLRLDLAPANVPRTVFISTFYRPAWIVTKGPAELTPALGGLMQVKVPAGTTTVKLAYRPRWIEAAYVIGTATLMLAAVGVLLLLAAKQGRKVGSTSGRHEQATRAAPKGRESMRFLWGRKLPVTLTAFGRSVLEPFKQVDPVALFLTLGATALAAAVFALIPEVSGRTARFAQEQVDTFFIVDSTPFRTAMVTFCFSLVAAGVTRRLLASKLASFSSIETPKLRLLETATGVAAIVLLGYLFLEIRLRDWTLLGYGSAVIIMSLATRLPVATCYAAAALGCALLLQPFAASSMLTTNGASLASIDVHMTAVFGGGEMLRLGYRPFSEVSFAYGLFVQLAVAAMGHPPDLSQIIKSVQVFQILVMGLFLLACWGATRGAEVAARGVAMLLLILVAAPFLSIGSPAVHYPNQSGLRFIMFAIAALVLLGLQGERLMRYSALAGISTALALWHNFETGLAVACALGLAWLVRIRSAQEQEGLVALLCVIAAAAATILASAVVFRGVIGAWPFPDLQSGSSLLETFASGFGGMRPSLRVVALVIFLHAGYVVVRGFAVVLGSRDRTVDVFSVGIAGMIIAWSPYYANRPADWNLWTSLVLYVLLLSPLIVRHWRRSGWLAVASALLVTPIPLSAAQTNYAHQRMGVDTFNNAPCAAGLSLPDNDCADHRSRMAELKRIVPVGQVHWVTAYTYSTLVDSGLRPILAPLDVTFSIRTERDLLDVASRIAERRPIAVLLDGGDPGSMGQSTPPSRRALHRRVLTQAGYRQCPLMKLSHWDVWLKPEDCAEGTLTVRKLKSSQAP